LTDFTYKDRNNSEIKSGDMLVLLGIAPNMPQPDSDDTLTIGSDILSVVKCHPISPAGVPIFYRVQVRK
jgi:hypothetical protein